MNNQVITHTSTTRSYIIGQIGNIVPFRPKPKVIESLIPKSSHRQKFDILVDTMMLYSEHHKDNKSVAKLRDGSVDFTQISVNDLVKWLVKYNPGRKSVDGKVSVRLR